MQIIVYSTCPVGCAVVTPAPGQHIDAVAARDVPAGAAFLILDDAALPTNAPAAALVLANGKITVDAATLAELTKPAVPASITDRQFAEGLWHDGIITYEQFLAFVGPGTIPQPLMDLLDTLPDDETGQPTPRKTAIGLVTGSTVYDRADPLVDIVRQAHGWSVEQLDDRWRVWASL